MSSHTELCSAVPADELKPACSPVAMVDMGRSSSTSWPVTQLLLVMFRHGNIFLYGRITVATIIIDSKSIRKDKVSW